MTAAPTSNDQERRAVLGLGRGRLPDRPRAYDQSGSPLPDLRAPGGSGAVKDVPISAPHDGLSHDTTIHVGTGEVGTLRSGAKSFVIGNVRAGDPFQIPAAHCGTHTPESWILGYAPNSGRWGYVQAQHLPACG